VATICSQCHSRPAELFDPSELKSELDRLGFLECAACHGHHRVVRPDDGLLAELAEGHTASGWKPEGRWRETASEYLRSIEDLSGVLEQVERSVARAESYGMDMTRARLKLSQARDRLIQARVVIHAFDPGRLAEVIRGTDEEPGGLPLARAAEEIADRAMDERSTRRVGLAISLAIIAALIATLLLKIRRMESAG
jgi:hypothetical protein